MDIEEILKETLEEILSKHLKIEHSDIEISEEEKDVYSINIKSDNPSILIGHHGETIKALQHLLKVLSWKKAGSDKNFNILLDVDDYRKRQEENVVQIAERKVDMARKTSRPQKLPPMSAYFRRKVHMHCMGAGYDDIETLSEGDGDNRYIIIKVKWWRKL